MRILFWSERFWPAIGGVGVSAAKLLTSLRKQGFVFLVVTQKDLTGRPEKDDYMGIPVYRFPFWTAVARDHIGSFVKLREKIFRLKRDFAPDLIHINFLGPSILFHFHTLKAHPAPLLLSLDSDLPEGTAGPDSLAGRALRSAGWVTCVSYERLTHARSLVGEITPRSSVIHNAREMPPIQPQPLPFESPRVLCLGRLEHVKGFDLAIKCFEKIAGRFPKARLIIAGDGPAREELKSAISRLGLEAVVDMRGWVHPDQVPALINAATLVMIPSRAEGLPVVSLEAALMARPVVASRVGGLKEIVIHQKTGILVDAEDHISLAQAASYLLRHPGEATQMGWNARRRAQKEFSWEQYVNAYNTLYKRLAKATSPLAA